MGRPGGLTPHIVQQQGIPPPVVQLLPAVAGGVDPGAAVQSVHAESGVVGDGRQARRGADGLGFQHGVFGKGLPRLLHVHSDPQVCGTHHLNAEFGQNSGHLSQFIGIVSGQHKLLRHQNLPPKASF